MSIDPTVAGLIAGTITHCFVQYPNQASLFSTLYAFLITNTIFLILILSPKNVIQSFGTRKIFQDWMTFDLVYVTIPVE